MGDFWVYENWVHDRARVHRAACSFCNNGDGTHDTTSTANGHWLPFDSYELAAASDAMRRGDASPCRTCWPDQ